jgi:hypothetical protein
MASLLPLSADQISGQPCGLSPRAGLFGTDRETDGAPVGRGRSLTIGLGGAGHEAVVVGCPTLRAHRACGGWPDWCAMRVTRSCQAR